MNIGRLAGSLCVSAGLVLCGTSVAEAQEMTEAERVQAVRCYVADVGEVEKISTVKERGTELLIVQYVLTPTSDSYIRCGVALPKPECWNGRFCGIGNCGHPTDYVRNFYDWTGFSEEVGCTMNLLKGNCVVATTDMGLSRGAVKKPEVWKDFGFRSTHLMTVTAKEIAKRYYGCLPKFSYFYGISTGGGQGMHEAQQFPEDYDGILAVVPASNRLQLQGQGLVFYQRSRTADGKQLFSDQQARTIAKAAVYYYQSRPDTPAYAAGRFVHDPRYDAQAAVEIANIAGKLDATMTPDMQQRIVTFFADSMIAGEKAAPGIPMSAGDLFQILGNGFDMFKWYYGEQFDMRTYDIDREFPKMAEIMGPWLNAENADLSAFFKRGGKLIAYSGADDCIVPVGSMWAYYERAIQAAGSLENLQKSFLYYIIPGRNHTRGYGLRILKDADRTLVDWVEKGIAPGKTHDTISNNGKQEAPVAAYPNMMTGDAASGFKVVPMPERRVVQPAERYLLTLSAEDAARECRCIKYQTPARP